MSDSQQELLRKAWTQGRKGTLSALSEAKVWALQEVWRSQGKGEWGLMNFVVERVEKFGGGHKKKKNFLHRNAKTCSHKVGKETHMLGANTVRLAKQLWLGG